MICLSSILSLISALALANCIAASSNVQAPLVGDDYVCQHPPYKAMLVSKSPLVMYIQGFLTPSERAHLQAVRYVRTWIVDPPSWPLLD